MVATSLGQSGVSVASLVPMELRREPGNVWDKLMEGIPVKDRRLRIERVFQRSVLVCYCFLVEYFPFLISDCPN